MRADDHHRGRRACYFDRLSAQPEPIEACAELSRSGLALSNQRPHPNKGAAGSLSACEHLPTAPAGQTGPQAGAPTTGMSPTVASDGHDVYDTGDVSWIVTCLTDSLT